MPAPDSGYVPDTRHESPSALADVGEEMPVSAAEMAGLLRVEQRRRWQRGERVRVEDYLARHPELAADATASTPKAGASSAPRTTGP